MLPMKPQLFESFIDFSVSPRKHFQRVETCQVAISMATNKLHAHQGFNTAEDPNSSNFSN